MVRFLCVILTTLAIFHVCAWVDVAEGQGDAAVEADVVLRGATLYDGSGAPVLTDGWEGLDTFFTPNSDILVAADAAGAIAAIDTGEDDLARIGRAGRERTLDEHTSDHRARALIAALELARTSARIRQTAEA